MSSVDFKLQQQIEIFIKKSKVSNRILKGKIVYISDHFITVQGENRIRESFSFIDFSLGKIQLRF